MSDDYFVTNEIYKEIIDKLNEAINTKVIYDVDKLKMAEACIEEMRIKIKLAKNSVGKIKGGCCPD